MTHDGMLITEFCTDYSVPNQIYLSTTRKTSSTNLSQSECLIRHCLISNFGTACILSYKQISDLSLCNPAVQNSVINILSRVCPLTIEEFVKQDKTIDILYYNLVFTSKHFFLLKLECLCEPLNKQIVIF